MARPKKKTVDYFPHMVNHGKTLYIIEQKYGNDGYAFWFKLLEMLGNTENHYLDLNDGATYEFLQAKTHTDDSLCTEILDLLARLESIDRELWEQKVVWSQRFVDGISDVYRNRRVETPTKPSFYTQKPQRDDVSTTESTQSKVKESKVNKSKGEESKGDTPAPLSDTQIIIDRIQESINPRLSSFDIELIQVWFSEHSTDIIMEAIKETALNKVTNIRYTDAILRNWKQQNIKTLIDLETMKSKQVKPSGRKGGYVASEPEWLERHVEYRDSKKDEVEQVDVGQLKNLLNSFKEE